MVGAPQHAGSPAAIMAVGYSVLQVVALRPQHVWRHTWSGPLPRWHSGQTSLACCSPSESVAWFEATVLAGVSQALPGVAAVVAAASLKITPWVKAC